MSGPSSALSDSPIPPASRRSLATASSAPSRAVELLPDPVLPALTRPLTLAGPHTYAAIWPYVRRATSSTGPAPIARQLVLVRDDGLLCLPGSPAAQDIAAEDSIEDPPSSSDERPESTTQSSLLSDTSLPIDYAPLPFDRLWSGPGLQSYLARRRPDPADIFRRLVSVLQHFFDFTGSLAPNDASLVAELLAAYVLATWFAPALPPLGLLWLHGDHGAGTSRLLHLLSRLAHLGLLLSALPSFSALSRLCSLGAAIAVDDAHFLSASRANGPQSIGQARRALLLAGRQRGALVPLAGRGAARLALVDISGPRLFASTHPPDPAIAAQCLVIPLLRTTDAARAALDPSGPASWPSGILLRNLVDDLWALSLSRLPELQSHLSHAAQAAASPPPPSEAGSPAPASSLRLPTTHLALLGSALQPWHAVLTVASWLSTSGDSRAAAVPGLLERLVHLAQSCHADRSAFETADLTVLAVRALFDCAIVCLTELARRAGFGTADDVYDVYDIRDVYDVHDVHDNLPDDQSPILSRALPAFFPCTAEAVQIAMSQISEKESWEIPPGKLNPKAIGHLLGRLGLQRHRTASFRLWLATPAALARLAQAYNLPLPPALAQAASTGHGDETSA